MNWSGAIQRLQRPSPRSAGGAPARRQQQSGGAVARFRCTRDSWSRQHNFFGKAEYTPARRQPRVLTSLRRGHDHAGSTKTSDARTAKPKTAPVSSSSRGLGNRLRGSMPPMVAAETGSRRMRIGVRPRSSRHRFQLSRPARVRHRVSRLKRTLGSPQTTNARGSIESRMNAPTFATALLPDSP
jgi:hypothetical protein